MSSRNIRSIIAVRYHENGEMSYHISDPDNTVAVLIVDERAPNDRVYEYKSRVDATEVLKIVGPLKDWGHSGDDQHARLSTKIRFQTEGLKIVPPSSDAKGTP